MGRRTPHILLNRKNEFFDNGKLKDGYSYEGGAGMVARGTADYNVRYGGGKDGLDYRIEQRTVYGKEAQPTAAPAPAAAPPPAPKAAPKPAPKPAPVQHSPEFKQAKERANSYKSDIIAGKPSEEIYKSKSSQPTVENQDYSKETYINRDSNSNTQYDFSAKTFANDVSDKKSTSQDFFNKKKDQLTSSPKYTEFMQ